jgi:hypothetical protein
MKNKIEKNSVDALLCTRIYIYIYPENYIPDQGLAELARPSISFLKYKPRK